MPHVQIADTCPIYRAGLHGLLEKEPCMTFAPDIANTAELLPKAQAAHADILICNMRLLGQETHTTLSQLRKDRLRVLIYTSAATPHAIQTAMANDVAGYTLIEEIETIVPLATIVNVVVGGRRWFSPTAQHCLLPRAARDLPTAREVQILNLMAKGTAPKTIAVKLRTTVKYVYKLQSNLREKFNVNTNLELIAKSQEAL
jgi:DNA-binding NarL/FixJ family response regulator